MVAKVVEVGIVVIVVVVLAAAVVIIVVGAVRRWRSWELLRDAWMKPKLQRCPPAPPAGARARARASGGHD